MRATWRNTLRVAPDYPHAKAERPKVSSLLSSCRVTTQHEETELRVYYHSPFMVLSRLTGLSALPLYVMQATDLHINSAEELDTLEAETYRRTNLHLAWNADTGEAFDCKDLYTAQVTVFKDGEGKLLELNYEMAVFATRFPKNPDIRSSMQDGRLVNEYATERVAGAVRDIFCGALAVARHYGHPAVVFGDIGIHDGHPPSQLATILQESVARYPVPLVLVAAGNGDLSQRDPEYEELYRVLRVPPAKLEEEEE